MGSQCSSGRAGSFSCSFASSFPNCALVPCKQACSPIRLWICAVHSLLLWNSSHSCLSVAPVFPSGHLKDAPKSASPSTFFGGTCNQDASGPPYPACCSPPFPSLHPSHGLYCFPADAGCLERCETGRSFTSLQHSWPLPLLSVLAPAFSSSPSCLQALLPSHNFLVGQLCRLPVVSAVIQIICALPQKIFSIVL